MEILQQTSTFRWIEWMQGKMSSSEKQEKENFMEVLISPTKSISTQDPIDPSDPKTKSKVNLT